MYHEWRSCGVFPGCCSQCIPVTIMRLEDRDEDGVWRKKPRGHMVWPAPEPCGPPSDPNRSHIYRSPYWVTEPEKIYR